MKPTDSVVGGGHVEKLWPLDNILIPYRGSHCKKYKKSLAEFNRNAIGGIRMMNRPRKRLPLESTTPAFFREDKKRPFKPSSATTHRPREPNTQKKRRLRPGERRGAPGSRAGPSPAAGATSQSEFREAPFESGDAPFGDALNLQSPHCWTLTPRTPPPAGVPSVPRSLRPRAPRGPAGTPAPEGSASGPCGEKGGASWAETRQVGNVEWFGICC